MRTTLLLLALSACTSSSPTMTIEVPEQLRSAQSNIEALVGWIWIFPQAERPAAPIDNAEIDPIEDNPLFALASPSSVTLENLTVGENRTVEIELAPGDYWLQVWFADDRFNPDEDALPLLAFASTNAFTVAPNQMNSVDTGIEAAFTREEGFDRDGDGESNLREAEAGTNPYDQTDRTCGIDQEVDCLPTTILDGPYAPPPNGARPLLFANSEPSPHGSVTFNHAGENPSTHALTVVRPATQQGPPMEIDELTAQSNPFADVAVNEMEGATLWCDGITQSIFRGGYNTAPLEFPVNDVPKELEVFWNGSNAVLYWSAWDSDNALTHLYAAPAETPFEPKAPFAVPDPPITGLQMHEALLLRVSADGTLYVAAGGIFWAFDPAGAQVGMIMPGVPVTDFVADAGNVFSLEYTVLWRREVSLEPSPAAVEMVSDMYASPPLAQDRDNIYWLSGEGQTKIRFIDKNSTAAMEEADDSYDVVNVPSGIRAFTVSDDGAEAREMFLIDGNGVLKRVFL